MQEPKPKAKKRRTVVRRIGAALLAALALTSCGVLEMREAAAPLPETNRSEDGLLTPAGRSPAEEASPETAVWIPEAQEETGPGPVTFAFAGDILIDTFIMSDAARRAGEGQSYSFVRSLSGIYTELNTADVTVGFDTTAEHPKNDPDPTHRTPEEAVAAFAEMGYDVLDTFAWNDPNGMFPRYGLVCLTTAPASGEEYLVLTEGGLRYALYAVGGGDPEREIGSEAALGHIAEAAAEADLVIVLADWDGDMTHDEQCAASYYMAEAGADVIVGTGDSIGPVDRLRTEDGTYSLVAYSLGTVLSTGGRWDALLGGILTFTAVPDGDGVYTVTDPILTPTFTHYNEKKQEYQVFPLSGYGDELAAEHGVSGFTTGGLRGYVRNIVPLEYLPKAYQD